jgi:hypothetical protein
MGSDKFPTIHASAGRSGLRQSTGERRMARLTRYVIDESADSAR